MIRLHQRVAAMILAGCFTASALAQHSVSAITSEAVFFNQGLRLSYGGQHSEGRRSFERYLATDQHHDDLVVRWRLLYDEFFDPAFSDAKGAGDTMLADADGAIRDYDRDGCANTDLGLTNGTLDCKGLGVALHIIREMIRLKYRNNLNAANLAADDADAAVALELAKESKSAQAKFLCGAHEYQAATRRHFGIKLSTYLDIAKSSIPRDKDHGIRLIKEAISDPRQEQSPFAPDVELFVLEIELHHKPGAAEFEAMWPHEALQAHLRDLYPSNRTVQGAENGN